MESLDLGSLVLVGAIVSLFVQFVKTHFATRKTETLLAVLIFSLVSGAGYVFVRDTSYFQTVVQIILAAGGIYTFVIKQFEK